MNEAIILKLQFQTIFERTGFKFQIEPKFIFMILFFLHIEHHNQYRIINN